MEAVAILNKVTPRSHPNNGLAENCRLAQPLP